MSARLFAFRPSVVEGAIYQDEWGRGCSDYTLEFQHDLRARRNSFYESKRGGLFRTIRTRLTFSRYNYIVGEVGVAWELPSVLGVGRACNFAYNVGPSSRFRGQLHA